MSKNHKNNAYSLVDEHTTTYENPFKFSAKELDDITGLYDHGARNRNPVSTLWYGVDPLWEKYPDFSPYNYCAGNPVRLVDPDGRAVYGRKNEDGTMSYIIGENENITAEGYEWIDDSYDCMDENGNYKTLPSANSTTTMSSTSQSQPTSQNTNISSFKEFNESANNNNSNTFDLDKNIKQYWANRYKETGDFGHWLKSKGAYDIDEKFSESVKPLYEGFALLNPVLG